MEDISDGEDDLSDFEFDLDDYSPQSFFNQVEVSHFFQSLQRGDAVASWFVRSTPYQAVRVRALTGVIVFCS